jgi:hypothetical protein
MIVLRTAAALLAALLLPACGGRHCAQDIPSPRVDQSQPTIDGSVGAQALGGTSEQMLAQVFTAGITGKITELQVPVEPISGDLVLELRDAPGGIPAATALSSDSFTAATLPAADVDGFRPLPLALPVDCVSGFRYALVLRATDLTAGGGFTLAQGPSGDPYPSGSAFFDARPNVPGTWVPTGSRDDLPFKVVVAPRPPFCDGTCGLLGLEAILALLLVGGLRRSAHGIERPNG